MRPAIMLATLGFIATGGAAAAPAPTPDQGPVKPKLIVALAVDQLSADLFNAYRAQFRGGFKRLAGGVVFPAGFQSHAATETCPGHSTILTGSRPARNGIIANSWFDTQSTRKKKDGSSEYKVYCAEDPRIPDTNTSNYQVSAQFLKVPTMGDRMRAADANVKVVSVSGKDRAAVMMGGHNTSLSLWWGDDSFVTYKGQDAKIPATIPAINARAKTLIDKPALQKLPAVCASRAQAVPISATANVGILQPRKAGDKRAIRASADLDQLTLDAALASMKALNLGRGPATDLLAISFSATDYVGHAFGTDGAEMCTQILALDTILGQLFSALDKTGIPYAVSLTADHGGHDLPERNRTSALPQAERVDAALDPKAIGKALAEKFGLSGNALLGDGAFGDVYLSPAVPDSKRKAVSDDALSYWRAHRQVEAVFTRADISAAPAPSGPPEDWSLMDKIKASYDPERSGDFVVVLKPYVTPIPNTGMGYVATHGSPWNYDRRVPILFWWKGVTPMEQPNGVETVDILPTLASLIGLRVPKAEIDGRCLDLIVGPNSNCE